MLDYDKLGWFYLGKRFDLDQNRPCDEKLNYESKDLTTHAVCVGMTGSGKTGLCLSVLEEAALDGVPAIAIDPKGDLGNLLLTFPDLRPADFAPWIDPAEAQRQNLSVEQLAAQTAERWTKGLAAWDQDGERIRRLRAATDVAIYTPGANIGLPLSVLRSFAPPPAAVLGDADALRERIGAAASGLLGLVGIDADPLQSREHILLANIFDRAWRAGQSPDLGELIRLIQTPPLTQVGVIDLETFFPAKDRFALAMRLNGLLASPGFSAWTQGEPLDVGRLLYGPNGQPRISIVSIAHLSDAERMFLVTLLLSEVVAWMRAQSGTSSLRALLYMDEVFGYFPPSANPPSKTPMLTLLKQARAFGLGVMLATQNPVDLDYKGLANAGTWFLGRLQTERDKARVLDGLEGASAAAGAKFDRQALSEILGRLGNRVFLMNNVHEDAPVVFQTRWSMSYLRGPLSRDQIAALMAARKTTSAGAAPPTAATAAAPPVAPAAAQPAGLSNAAGGARPMLPPGVTECFGAAAGSASVAYRPTLLGVARLHFVDAKNGIDAWQTARLAACADATATANVWEGAEELDEAAAETSAEPAAGATFAVLPPEFSRPKSYASWGTALKNHLYQSRTLQLLRCDALGQTSRPDEAERDFRIRLGQLAREGRDRAVEALRARYAAKAAALAEKIRRAQQKLEKEQAQAKEKDFGAAISLGTSLLGALLGRKVGSQSNVTRAASAMRSAGRAVQERGDVQHAQATLETLQEELQQVETELAGEIDKLEAASRPESLQLAPVSVRARKGDLVVEKVALMWVGR